MKKTNININNETNVNQDTISGGNTMNNEANVIPTILAAENNTKVAEEFLQQAGSVTKQPVEKKDINTAGKDRQSAKFQITINNPIEKGYTHEQITKILQTYFKTLAYHCMADEMGSCFHTHVFVACNSRVRRSMVVNYFPGTHVEICKGTISDNINYIRKSGKWELDKKKQEQKIEGTFEEYGVRPPDSKGKRMDMSELYRLILDGYTDAEIIAINQDYIPYLNQIRQLRTTLLADKFKSRPRDDMEVVYVSGKTRTGKTRGVLEECGYENVYRCTEYKNPFDGYQCQPAILFDEFRDSIKLSDMLNYCDVYPLELPSRYNNKFACYNKVYIVSNWSLEEQYKEAQEKDRESYQAFLKRINKVVVYDGFMRYTVYNSPDEYLRRYDSNELF